MDSRREGDPDQTITAPTPPQGRDPVEQATGYLEGRNADRGQITAPTPPQGRDHVPLTGLEVVDLNDAENISHWCERWQVSPEQLREAVERGGGNDSPTVSLALGLEAP